MQDKRKRVMTQRALEYTLANKRGIAKSLEDKLRRTITNVEALTPNARTSNTLRDLEVATQEFELVLGELVSLSNQDKYGVLESEAILTSESSLKYAHKLIAQLKNTRKSGKSSETASVRSHNSRRSGASRASTSSSAVRMRAAAEAAAAKEQAEYERLMAEKENEMRQREAAEEKRRQQARAQKGISRLWPPIERSPSQTLGSKQSSKRLQSGNLATLQKSPIWTLRTARKEPELGSTPVPPPRPQRILPQGKPTPRNISTPVKMGTP